MLRVALPPDDTVPQGGLSQGESLTRGKTLAAFLDDFEGVPHEEAIAALEQAYERLLASLPYPGSVAEPTPT